MLDERITDKISGGRISARLQIKSSPNNYHASTLYLSTMDYQVSLTMPPYLHTRILNIPHRIAQVRNSAAEE
jgi:hypothetical protein